MGIALGSLLFALFFIFIIVPQINEAEDKTPREEDEMQIDYIRRWATEQELKKKEKLLKEANRVKRRNL